MREILDEYNKFCEGKDEDWIYDMTYEFLDNLTRGQGCMLMEFVKKALLEENQAQTTLKQELREGIMAIKYAKHNPNKDCGCETCVITNKLLKFLEEERR